MVDPSTTHGLTELTAGDRMLFLPESPRFLVHKGRTLEAYRVWRRLRGIESMEANREFYFMKASVEAEEQDIHANAVHKSMPWLDFFTWVLDCGIS